MSKTRSSGKKFEQMQLSIRKAQPSDALAMKGCVDAAYRHYIPRIGKSPGPMLDDYAKVIQHHDAFVSETEGRVVGVLVLIRTESGMLLDNVAVHPDLQGEGLGSRLLELAESESRNLGHSHLELYTHACMTENIAMYKHMGYVETERKTEQGYRRVYMSKALR